MLAALCNCSAELALLRRCNQFRNRSELESISLLFRFGLACGAIACAVAAELCFELCLDLIFALVVGFDYLIGCLLLAISAQSKQTCKQRRAVCFGLFLAGVCFAERLSKPSPSQQSKIGSRENCSAPEREFINRRRIYTLFVSARAICSSANLSQIDAPTKLEAGIDFRKASSGNFQGSKLAASKTLESATKQSRNLSTESSLLASSANFRQRSYQAEQRRKSHSNASSTQSAVDKINCFSLGPVCDFGAFCWSALFAGAARNEPSRRRSKAREINSRLHCSPLHCFSAQIWRALCVCGFGSFALSRPANLASTHSAFRELQLRSISPLLLARTSNFEPRNRQEEKKRRKAGELISCAPVAKVCS